MNTIGKDVIVEQEINKSSFITYLKLVTTPLDARNYIKEIKEIHPNATHHVTVYLVGPTGEHGHANDDGEPSGTAGLPVLDVFKKNDITNFVCIVVRYFGGIKLGAGGLVRAYSSSASLALKEAGIAPIINYETLELIFNYGFMNIIENKLKSYEILAKDFTTNVTLKVKVPESDVSTIKDILISLTNNQIIIK